MAPQFWAICSRSFWTPRRGAKATGRSVGSGFAMPPLSQSLAVQLIVLLPRQLQPHRASSHADPVFDRLAAGEIEIGAAMPGQVQDLDLTLEREVTGKGSLAVLFQERHRPPTLCQHELHQDSVPRRAPRTVAFAGFLVGLWWQRDLAGAADLACQPHSCG